MLANFCRFDVKAMSAAPKELLRVASTQLNSFMTAPGIYTRMKESAKIGSTNIFWGNR